MGSSQGYVWTAGLGLSLLPVDPPAPSWASMALQFYKEAPLFQKVSHGELVASQVMGARLALLCIEQMAACDTQVGISFPSSLQCQPPTAICSSLPAGYFYHGTGEKKVMLFLHIFP